MYGFGSVIAPAAAVTDIDINSNVLLIGALLIGIHMKVMRMKAFRKFQRDYHNSMYKNIKKKRIYKLR